MKRAIVLLSFAALAFAAEDRSNERRTFFNVRELSIDNINGLIEVTAAAGNTVEMDLTTTFKARSQDRLDEMKREIKLDVSEGAGLLKLTVDGPFRDKDRNRNRDRRFDWEREEFTFEFKLRVPRDVKLDLHTVNSGISVNGTAAEFRLKTVNGGIEVRDAEAGGSAETVNGGVKAVFTRNPTAPVQFKTVNGGLDAVFRPDLRADITARTLNGGVYTDFPVTVGGNGNNGVFNRDRTTNVRIGGGGPQLRFETVNGSIMIKDRER